MQRRVKAETVEPVDEKDGSAGLRIGRNDGRRARCCFNFRRFDDRVEPLELGRDALVMLPDQKRDADQRAGDNKRNPCTFEEFNERERDQDERCQDETKSVDRKLVPPGGIAVAHLPPVNDHAELREGECHEDIDRIKHDQSID